LALRRLFVATHKQDSAGGLFLDGKNSKRIKNILFFNNYLLYLQKLKRKTIWLNGGTLLAL
jgi:hypothetical protein